MFEILVLALSAVFIFVIGAAVGAHNAATVDKAIATIKQTETNAKAQLDKIIAHKAS